ncbi:Flp pilus assembly protein CpaB [Phenylobacterium sp.]|uniref:Flp pilus assembly protein CpaB n=1 Tax=Phenylobacterium sp. TaxID=1871053 RepID=UPI00356319A4
MRVVTIVSLGACAVFGLGALVVAKTMLPNGAAAKPVAAEAVGLPVVAAKAPLKFGDRLDASKLMIVKLPSNAVPEGAFTTVAQVLAQDGGGAPVALTPIAARETLLPSKLSGPGARASVAAEIGEGFRAYTIKVSDVTGVGGHALPGDRVDVVLMRDTTPAGPARNFVSEVVIQNIRVLGVDLNADLSSNKPATPTTATLEVSVPDAQKLAVAGDLGKLSLALRKTGSTEIAMTTTMRVGGAAPRPVQAVAHRSFAAPAAPAGPSLIMIVADEAKGHARAPKKAPAPPPPPAPPAAPSAANTSFTPSALS